MAKRFLSATKNETYAVKAVFRPFVEAKKSQFSFMTLSRRRSISLRPNKIKGLYFVSRGLLKLEMFNPAPRFLRLVMPGDIVGFRLWQPAFAGEYEVTALEDSELAFIPAPMAEGFMANDEEFRDLVVEHLQSTIQHKNERIAALESQGAEERVVRLVLWLASRFGRKIGAEIEITLALDRPSMAQLAGLIPETYSRMISSLYDRGWVRRQRRKLIVTDLAALQTYIQRR